MGRALERDVSIVHRIQILRGGTSAYSFVSNPEDWKAGWTEYWLQHAVPPGRLTPGSYAVEWQLGSTMVARIPLSVQAR